MTSLYSINYHLRAHKRDTFIEFIKSLLLTPFVLHSRPSSSNRESLEWLNENGVDAATPSLATSSPAEITNSDKNITRYLEILGCVEDLIQDHILHWNAGVPEISRLSQLVPSIGRFFTPLPLVEAFLEQNRKRAIASRRFVPPSFNDIRYVLNYAQIKSISTQLSLITFDGDMTLYADGADFKRDSHLVELIISLLRFNVKVAIVTAAGYPGNTAKYEQRLSGLLEGFSTSGLSKDALSQFYVLGGECNYLFRYDPEIQGLVYISEEVYQSPSIRKWTTDVERVKAFLDVAETNLLECAKEMNIADKVRIMRKPMAIGIMSTDTSLFKLSREQLDEFALSTQKRLNHYQHLQICRQRMTLATGGQTPVLPKFRDTVLASVSGGENTNTQKVAEGEKQLWPHDIMPFCAFNGGSEVWVDVGNKLIGIQILQQYLGTKECETLHVGDQFLSTGNDIATRSACCTIWITSPDETAECLVELNRFLANAHSE